MNNVGYKKARTQEPEVEPCMLISASPPDDVANKNACSRQEKICIKSRVVTVQSHRGLDPCAARDRTTCHSVTRCALARAQFELH